MKKYILLAIIGASLFALESCNSFLEEKPVASVLTPEAVTDSAGAEAALNGAYDILQEPDLYGDKTLVFPEMSADNLRNTGSYDTDKQVDQNLIVPDNITVGNIWYYYYNGIGRCNTAIDAIGKLTKLTPEKRNDLLGHFRFLRGFIHFDLMRNFGSVPLVLQPTTEGTNVPKPTRTPIDELYAGIIADLEFARDNITDPYGQRPIPYYASALSAKAMLARLYLHKRDYANAAQYADEVIQETGIYTDDGPGSYEKIFTSFDTYEHIFVLEFNQTDQNVLAQANTPSAIVRYALDPSLRDTFPDTDLRRATALTPAKTRCNKYRDRQNGTDKVILIRAAEMVLARAEANAYLNKLDDALADLNEVRARAGLDPLASTDQKEILMAIEHERRLELCFEGHRFYDLVRQPDFDNPSITRAEALLGIESFRTLFPIPNREIINNKNLTQNPGY